MFDLFKRKKTPNPFKTDLHSHLIPGIDDGARNMEDAIAIIRALNSYGYEHFVTTPHIMGDFYPNTPDIIRKGLADLKDRLSREGIDCTLEAAAEYHLDEKLMADLESNVEMLTFGDRYFLFETPFMNEPVYLKELIFAISSRGWKPVMAHPERYAYLLNNQNLIEDLQDRGVLFQVNLISLTGYYSPAVKKMAEKLIRAGQVHFLGSDCHNLKHASLIGDALQHRLVSRIGDRMLNNTLQ